MRDFIDFNQIRINAVLGVCARQRELAAENRRLLQQQRKKDDIAGYIGFAVAVMLTAVCLL